VAEEEAVPVTVRDAVREAEAVLVGVPVGPRVTVVETEAVPDTVVVPLPVDV